MSIVTNAVRNFRKMLEAGCRNGFYKLRVYGSAGCWYLGVERGKNIVEVRSNFMTQSSAILAGLRIFGTKASVYRSRKAA